MTRADERSASQAEFDKLYKEWLPSAYSQAYRAVRNQAEAEDLTQEAFVKAYLAFDSYRRNQPFRHWLYRILSNLIIEKFRKNRKNRRVQVLLEEQLSEESERGETFFVKLVDTDPSPEEACLARESRTGLFQEIQRLPDEYRQVIILHYFQQYSYQEIAEATGCPIGTIRSRMHRGRKQLKNWLGTNPTHANLL
jgi:RNA polymerase sigma-70 factor (ECF subfamily)